MIYRLLQFKHALAPRIDPQDLDWAKRVLPPQAYTLFIAQSPVEQQHALEVAKYLRRYRHELTPNDFRILIQAALLHDCGKQRFPINLWHRVCIVVFGKITPKMKKRVAGFPCLAHPLMISEEHPSWGRDFAANAGLPEEVCKLIEGHHQPSQNKLGRLLYLADNNN